MHLYFYITALAVACLVTMVTGISCLYAKQYKIYYTDANDYIWWHQ